MALAVGQCGLLRLRKMIFQSLRLRQEADCLGDLRVPVGPYLQAFELAELRSEELALDAFLTQSMLLAMSASV